ncbi:unnamed protein product [Rotaria sp. Silwood1]|nr:unnamed protein product [Rotaria sp. Silwood1]
MAEAVEETILCQHCNTLINTDNWTEHSKNCRVVKKNRRRHRRQKSVNEELDNEKIPCEFCNDQINVNDWNSHAEQCADAHRRRIENLKNGIDNEPMNILVPCEYCNKQISVQDLEWHTVYKTSSILLLFRKSVNDELDNEKIPCEFCNDQINVNDWNSHAEQCADAHRRRIENLKNGIDNEPINILVPCEYCNKQISVQDLEWHTRQCDDEYQRQRQILQNNETDFISCEYCNAQVSIVEWELHVKRCRRKETSSTFQPNALHDEVFGVIHTFPKHWDLSSLDNLTRYILDHTTEEYKFVANKFHKTLPSNHIIQIERIQNRRWYRQYDAHKEDFIERYGQSTERWLFHGCRKSESAEAIIRDCFNRSHAVNCARVLIGRTTGGSSSTRICPPGFDTTGGENVFVTYHDAQAYGEYLIVYK